MLGEFSFASPISRIYYIYINPQELILRPIAASEKSEVVAGIYYILSELVPLVSVELHS